MVWFCRNGANCYGSCRRIFLSQLVYGSIQHLPSGMAEHYIPSCFLRTLYGTASYAGTRLVWKKASLQKYHFREEYQTILGQGNFFSESTFNRTTGSTVRVPEGRYYAITNDEETAPWFVNSECKLITDVTTGQTYPIAFEGILHNNIFSLWGNYYVINDQDYEKMAAELPDDFRASFIQFNMGADDSYAFSKALYNQILDSFDESCFYTIFHDPVTSFGTDISKEQTALSAEERNTSDFHFK